MKNFLDSFSLEEKDIFNNWLNSLVNKILSDVSFKKKLLKDNSIALKSLNSNINEKFILKIEKNKDSKINIQLEKKILKISLPNNNNLNEQVLDSVSGGLTTIVEVTRGQDGKLYYAEGAVSTDGNLNIDLNERTGAFRLKTSN